LFESLSSTASSLCPALPLAALISPPPIFPELAKARFEGWIIVEAEQDPAKALPLRYAKMAREYLCQQLGF
jgi:inosose dehydratase